MPLISLIEDNLNFVINVGIPACSLSGANKKTEKSIGHYYQEIKAGQHKIVYTTPEMLVKSPGLNSTLDELYSTNRIDRFVIDEVHCVSHWGQDFRKDYLHLDQLKKRFPKVPILGLTATATVKVKDDIIQRLGIKSTCVCFQSSFNRPNLLYEIREKNSKKVEQDIADILKKRFINKCGIIYCISRKDCENIAENLKRNFKIKCEYYHAELSHAKRSEV
jgi:bloom syndrome protein